MLTKPDINLVVNQYIGVTAGYLGDFSYRTHAEFYPEYCDLEYDPNEIEGTTRTRFIHILSNAPAHHQAKILRGVLDRFPIDSYPEDQRDQKRAVAARIESMIARLGGVAVAAPVIGSARQVVEHALADAETAIAHGRPAGAVDRLHTALHGYARELCVRHNVVVVATRSGHAEARLFVS